MIGAENVGWITLRKWRPLFIVVQKVHFPRRWQLEYHTFVCCCDFKCLFRLMNCVHSDKRHRSGMCHECIISNERWWRSYNRFVFHPNHFIKPFKGQFLLIYNTAKWLTAIASTPKLSASVVNSLIITYTVVY